MKCEKFNDKKKMKSRREKVERSKKKAQDMLKLSFYKYLMNLYMSLDDHICFVDFPFAVPPSLPFNKTTIVMIHIILRFVRVTWSNFKGRFNKAHVKNVLKNLLNNALL